MGVPLGERECFLFSKYYENIRLWNSKMNLVSVQKDDEIPLKHFLDSLTPVPFLPRTNLRILDIGTGPGLPGIPIKIAVDAWHVSLLEASRKRTSFLKDTNRQLDLHNIDVIHDRVENLIGRTPYGQSFDVVISRATFKLSQLIEVSCFFLNNTGCLLAMKGAIPESEWVDAIQVSEKTGLLCQEEHNIVTPFNNTPRKIIIYKKAINNR